MNGRLPHDELQLLLGAYVLGGLSPDDRRRLEEHLRECAACSAELARYAGIPALLQLAPGPTEVAAEPAPPPESLPRLIAAARQQRRARQRMRWILAAAAVVLVLAGVAGSVLITGRGTPTPAPDTISVATSSGTKVVGQAVLDPKSWGTEVHLELDYEPYGKQPYAAWAVSIDGHEEQAAAWSMPPDGKCSVTGATSIKRDKLDRIEVRTADGRTLLRTR